MRNNQPFQFTFGSITRRNFTDSCLQAASTIPNLHHHHQPFQSVKPLSQRQGSLNKQKPASPLYCC
ncbi:unnamed protein product [Coffea canephora]|uniref:Uncharacterized protein n=1 Tax=Coffea canephora TaxID=49390 RepID=A0A068UVE9_COFCA|nr:unnamed protein product [Coffea canephora]